MMTETKGDDRYKGDGRDKGGSGGRREQVGQDRASWARREQVGQDASIRNPPAASTCHLSLSPCLVDLV